VRLLDTDACDIRHC